MVLSVLPYTEFPQIKTLEPHICPAPVPHVVHYVPHRALSVEMSQESVELAQLASVISLADLGVQHLR